jgi:hypothetical protein
MTYELKSTLESLVNAFTKMSISNTPIIVGDAYFIIRFNLCEHAVEIYCNATGLSTKTEQYTVDKMVKDLQKRIDGCSMVRLTIEYRCIFETFNVSQEELRTDKSQWFSLLNFCSTDHTGLRANLYPVVWEFQVEIVQEHDCL